MVRLPSCRSRRRSPRCWGRSTTRSPPTSASIGSLDELVVRTSERAAVDGARRAAVVAGAVRERASLHQGTPRARGRVVVRIAELNSGSVRIDGLQRHRRCRRRTVHARAICCSRWSGSLTVARWYRPEAIVQPAHLQGRSRLERCRCGWSIRLCTRSWPSSRRSRPTRRPRWGTSSDATSMSPCASRARSDVDDWTSSMTGLLGSAARGREREPAGSPATRDELLPLLMSGKVRVKDAEKTVEGGAVMVSEAEWEEQMRSTRSSFHGVAARRRARPIAPGAEGGRESWDDIVLPAGLLDALRKLNPTVPGEYLEQALAEIRRAEVAGRDRGELPAAPDPGRRLPGDHLHRLRRRRAEPDDPVRQPQRRRQRVPRRQPGHDPLGRGRATLRRRALPQRPAGRRSSSSRRPAPSRPTSPSAHAQLATYLREFPMAFRFVRAHDHQRRHHRPLRHAVHAARTTTRRGTSTTTAGRAVRRRSPTTAACAHSSWST